MPPCGAKRSRFKPLSPSLCFSPVRGKTCFAEREPARHVGAFSPPLPALSVPPLSALCLTCGTHGSMAASAGLR
eukprot:360282-Chlamydomonas_euryale.AAC.9